MLNPSDLDLDDDFFEEAPASPAKPSGDPVVAPAVPAALEPDSVAAQALYQVWSGQRIVQIYRDAVICVAGSHSSPLHGRSAVITHRE